MKKIGKEVLFIKTSENNPRNGEGTFIRLKDGRIMCAYTEYYGDSWSDHAIARISACCSNDDGETWSETFILLEKDEKAENIMSATLLRLKNGDLGMVYLRKEKMSDGGISCMPTFVCSQDEGKTWSNPVICGLDEGYYCTINDGVTVLKNGRILVPSSYYGLRYGKGEYKGGVLVLTYSDDNGKTWNELGPRIRSPYNDSIGFAEPGVFEYDNNELWLYFRTGYGHQYQSFSKDGGLSWTDPAPNFCFTSPDAPMRVKRVGKYVVAVFNPFGYSCANDAAEIWGSPKRTPLICAVSEDDGRSFDTTNKAPVNRQMKHFAENAYYIEDDINDSYCYPAIIEVNDGFLISYYHSNGTGVCLNSLKIVKIYYDEIN